VPVHEFVQAVLEGNAAVRPSVLVNCHGLQSPAAESIVKHLAYSLNARAVHSAERMIDQASLVLHRAVGSLPEAGRSLLERLYNNEAVLAGKTVLIVDDDIRNIFALASVLERENMEIQSAETGHDAIRLLKEVREIDIVLMDIMMPEMDGIATMKEIRKLSQFKNLPIIAVTAKAMKGDREKCIEAGAWDYLSKPVDTEQMLSLMRMWLYR
jgi:CheY-like chemotaxis protein